MPAKKYRLPIPKLAEEYGVSRPTLERYARAGVNIDDPVAVARHRALKNPDSITPISRQIDEFLQTKTVVQVGQRPIDEKKVDHKAGLETKMSDSIEQLKKDEKNKSDLLAERVRKTRADADFREQQNALLRGRLAPIADVKIEARALAAMLSAEWTSFAREAATLFAERTVAEIEAIAMPWVSDKLEALLDRLSHIGEDAAVRAAQEARPEKPKENGGEAEG